MAGAAGGQQKRYVGVKETLIYGIANGGQTMSYTFMASYLSYFFVNVFGIDPSAVAFMIFIVGIWDTFNDPLMGMVIDKTRTRFGKLRPWLLIVPIPLAIATCMLFAGPMFFQGTPGAAVQKVVYMYFSYIIWELFYTIGDVPFWGLSASISPNPADRTRVISSARFISAIIGGLPGIVVAPMIDLVKGGNTSMSMPQVFFILGLIMGVVGIGIFSIAGIFCKERVVQSIEEPTLMDGFRALVHNKPLLLIILSNILGCLGNIFDIFTNYLYIDVLGSATLGIIIGIPGMVVNFGSYALIPVLKKRMDNKQIFMFATVGKAAIHIGTFFVGIGCLHSVGLMSVILAVRGILYALFNAVTMVTPTEMIGDTTDYMEWKSGTRNEGVNFSILTFISKFTGSMSKSFGTLALKLIGYQTAVTGSIVVQSMRTQRGIWSMYTIIPGLLSLLGIIPFFFYRLSGKQLVEIREELEIRREKVSEEISQGKYDKPITENKEDGADA